MPAFKNLLEEIFQNDSPFISSIVKSKGVYYNNAIFHWPVDNLWTYKKDFFDSLNSKLEKLEIAKWKVEKSESITEAEKELLMQELTVLKAKINIKKEVYGIEANKINPDFEIKDDDEVDFDKYNELFFQTSVEKLKKWDYKSIESYDFPPQTEIEIPKYELVKLLSIVNKYSPDLQFNFWDFINLSHSKWKIKIPDMTSYNLRTVITIFFHEVSHHFRFLNQYEKFGIKTSFSDYFELEEWLAIYNEYTYWNEIINIGEFVPFYDLCYKILLEDISEEEKKDKIFEILKYKWFPRSKSDSYYQRFNRFTKIGDKNLFLKDLIYYNSYKIVKDLIKKDPNFKVKAYSLMWGTKSLNLFPEFEPKFDPTEYFEEIKQEIIKLKNQYE